MKTLIESHKLNQLINNFKDFDDLQYLLKIQNQLLRCCFSEEEKIVIISIPHFDDQITRGGELTKITSSGVVLILNLDESNGKFNLIKILSSGRNFNFEFFGNNIEMSQNGKFIIVTTGINRFYIYNNKGELIQTEYFSEEFCTRTGLGENLLLSRNNEQLLISDQQYSTKEKKNSGRVLLLKFNHEKGIFEIDHIFLPTTPIENGYFGCFVSTNYNNNETTKINKIVITDMKANRNSYVLINDIWNLEQPTGK